MNIVLDDNSGQETLFDGYAWHEGRYVDAASSAATFSAMDCPAFLRAVGQCNGLFRVIVRRPGELLAAVDRVRSHPLFYGFKDGKTFLSHDAYWLRRQLGDMRPELDAATELWHLLYVLDDRTLAAGVRQLPPGHALHVRTTPQGTTAEQIGYYSYLQRPGEATDAPGLMDRLDGILDRAFARLLESARGRQLVIPLSGGLDSRLVACMLKRLEAPEVLCFSYGMPGNAESLASEQVARRLGLPWEFVSYRDVDWHSSEQRRQRGRFSRFSSNLCALPPLLEDYLAVEALQRRGRVAREAVFCPGHTACFSSGRRALEAAGQTTDELGLAEVILRQNCPRLHWKESSDAARAVLCRRVFQGLRRLRAQSPGSWEGPMLLEGWNWMERQCKRIINMARAYEFWGCSWRIALWDHELMDFWGGIPFPLRRGKALYRQYLLSRSGSRFFGLYDHLARADGATGTLGGLLGRGAGRISWLRYFMSQDNFERLLCGGYGRYLRTVGRRALSLEPVTPPWLLLEQGGLEEIWSADEDLSVGEAGAAEPVLRLPCNAS